MKKKSSCPKPIHVINVIFQSPRKKYTQHVKIFKTDAELNEYYKKAQPTNVDPNGVYAAILYDKNPGGDFIGEMILSLEYLNPGLVAHESVHMVSNYYREVYGSVFSKKREEDFCEHVEGIVNLVYAYVEKHKIPYSNIPSYRKIRLG